MKLPKLSEIKIKGFTLGDVIPLSVTFVILGIVLGMGALILSQVGNQLPANSASIAAVENGTKAIATFSSWLPILAIVLVAAVVIGVVLSSFMGPRR
jgi:type II secretory pathway component PulF